jgi:hypothetical protein
MMKNRVAGGRDEIVAKTAIALHDDAVVIESSSSVVSLVWSSFLLVKMCRIFVSDR